MVKRRVSKYGILVVVLVLMVGLSFSYVASTYAKYTGTVEGNSTAQVAKWSFEEDNMVDTLDIDFTDTYNETTLVADRIAPGTSGAFSINVVNDNSETGVNFEVSLGSIENIPTNLKFYLDNQYKTEIKPGEDNVTGTLIAGDSIGLDVKIYWKWAYVQSDVVTGDAADTLDGRAAKKLTIPITITGVQATPNTSAITNEIN